MTEDVWITFDHSDQNQTTLYEVYLHISDRPQGQGHGQDYILKQIYKIYQS